MNLSLIPGVSHALKKAQVTLDKCAMQQWSSEHKQFDLCIPLKTDCLSNQSKVARYEDKCIIISHITFNLFFPLQTWSKQTNNLTFPEGSPNLRKFLSIYLARKQNIKTFSQLRCWNSAGWQGNTASNQQQQSTVCLISMPDGFW